MISSEMGELIGMSDRIMVMCDGRVTGFIDGDKANQENICPLYTSPLRGIKGLPAKAPCF